MSTLLMLLMLTTMSSEPELPPDRHVVACPLELTAGVPLLRVQLTAGRDAWFAIDTGASGTTVSRALARRLDLPVVGTTVVGTLAGATTVDTVRLEGLRLPGVDIAHTLVAAVHDLAAVRRVAPNADGILGQDVLARYDYLIDYDERRLLVGRFDPPSDGVGLPLAWSAGRPVLLVPGTRNTHGLVLDSGADALVMESVASRDAVRSGPAHRRWASLDTHAGPRAVEVESHAALGLAHLSLNAVDLVRLPAEAWHMAPEVGLLPAAYFARVYVSARTGQAVVWEK